MTGKEQRSRGDREGGKEHEWEATSRNLPSCLPPGSLSPLSVSLPSSFLLCSLSPLEIYRVVSVLAHSFFVAMVDFILQKGLGVVAW